MLYSYPVIRLVMVTFQDEFRIYYSILLPSSHFLSFYFQLIILVSYLTICYKSVYFKSYFL